MHDTVRKPAAPLFTALAAGLIGLLASAAARAETPIENGCGPSGILSWVVPDYIPIAGCKLVRACNAHDRCYSKCLPGQPLHGNPTCKDDVAREARRRICDNRLYNDIVTANPGSWTCKGVAGLYKKFVVAYGISHFLGAVPGPPKELLYRMPPEAAVDQMGTGSAANVKQILATNFAAMQAFTAYLEAHPGTFDEADAQAAIDSAVELGIEPDSLLDFRHTQHAVSLNLIVAGTAGEKRELVLWEQATP